MKNLTHGTKLLACLFLSMEDAALSTASSNVSLFFYLCKTSAQKRASWYAFNVYLDTKVQTEVILASKPPTHKRHPFGNFTT